MDETYVKVKGQWRYRSRAVDTYDGARAQLSGRHVQSEPELKAQQS